MLWKIFVMKHLWEIDSIDLEKGREIIESERIKPPLNTEKIFSAAVYCILSAAEKYQKIKPVFLELEKQHLTTGSKIIEEKEKFKNIIKAIRFANTKEKHIYELVEWWDGSNIPKELVEDGNGLKKREFELRNELAERAPGLSYKSASFLMTKCGYENVVILDIWIIRFLKNKGYEVKLPDYRKISGPTKKEYLIYEKNFQKIAEEYKITPLELQAAIWGKYSTYNKTNNLP